ncbi:MAG TPA: NUDIX hydrolase [Steroidobacteraceae bacterium]|nr:NUDIX hydrolase [Steroidobacteraceae bacterium]
MTWKPDVTVAAIIENEGRFLMVEEHVGHRLVFNQPAGHLEVNESFTAAVIRETLEETAWTFVPDSVTGIYLWQHPERNVSFLRVTFCGKVTDHDADRPLDHGIKRALWLSRDELDQKQSQLRSPMVTKCIDDYLAGTRYPLTMLTHLAAIKAPTV